MLPATPRGFRDILPGEAAWRESIVEDVQARFASWGYMPLETPTLEVLDTMEAGGGGTDRPIKLFDSDGKLLVLRPDVTLPIARMVATRLSDNEAPMRFRYTEPVFREEESLHAREREFTQLGVESIGLSGTYADAEVVALFVEALQATGLEDFTVAIASVTVLRALIAGAGMPDSWKQEVLAAYHASNLVALEELSRREGVAPGFGEALRHLPHIRGGRESIIECRQLAEICDAPSGLDDLLQTWDILESAGVTGYVTVDFSVMSSFDYYTGLIIEAFAPGLGLSIGSGGRYDSMLEAYGRQLPAAGFAFSLERVMGALAGQGKKVRKRTPDVLIGGEDMGKVFLAAQTLRSMGQKVCITAREDILAEARRRGIERAVQVDAHGKITNL